MGRLRATLANSEIDRLVANEVMSAHRAVDRAIRACRGTKTGAEVSAARLRRVVRDLHRAQSALANVSQVQSPYGPDPDGPDPDLLSEAERSDQFWADRRAKRAEEEVEEVKETEAEVEVEAPTPENEDDEGGE